MRTWTLALLAVLMRSCARVEGSRQVVDVDMANVDLHVTSDVTLHIKEMRGHFTAVGRDVPSLDDKRSNAVFVDSGEVAIDFASLNALPPRQPPPRPLAPNHIYWRGSQLSFGKLTMTDTDLELVDADPKDRFDFSVDHWNAQLVAGYSKTLSNRGLKAYLPDYNDLRSH